MAPFCFNWRHRELSSMLTGPSTVPQSLFACVEQLYYMPARSLWVVLGFQGSIMRAQVVYACCFLHGICMLTCGAYCCSMSRLGGSNGASNAQASSLGSNTSMESAKTAAAAQREPQLMAEDSEQAREAAALVEWIHEQVHFLLRFGNGFTVRERQYAHYVVCKILPQLRLLSCLVQVQTPAMCVNIVAASSPAVTSARCTVKGHMLYVLRVMH